MITETKTSTGYIFSDTERQLEFLYMADYNKDVTVKADFLGLCDKPILPIQGVQPAPLENKMVVTISTQHGCSQACRFCDCPKLKFNGNVSFDDLEWQVTHAISHSGCRKTKRLNVHYARMGEPTCNDENVIRHAASMFWNKELRDFAETIHPVVSTMMPKNHPSLHSSIGAWIITKNQIYDGNAGLQLSINTTDEQVRDWMFGGLSLSLNDIASLMSKMQKPKGRKYILNFALSGWPIDAVKLAKLFSPDIFMCKLTPMNNTNACNSNNILVTGCTDYRPYEESEHNLIKAGFDTLVCINSLEAGQDRVSCGNLLLAHQ